MQVESIGPYENQESSNLQERVSNLEVNIFSYKCYNCIVIVGLTMHKLYMYSVDLNLLAAPLLHSCATASNLGVYKFRRLLGVCIYNSFIQHSLMHPNKCLM